MRTDTVNVFEDYEGAVKLAANKNAIRGIKHINVKHNLVRDACDVGEGYTGVCQDERSARGLVPRAARHTNVLQ